MECESEAYVLGQLVSEAEAQLAQPDLDEPTREWVQTALRSWQERRRQPPLAPLRGPTARPRSASPGPTARRSSAWPSDLA
eukprot:2762163-Heterocapsa_arctica.AAC.1